jgi:probable HAF family extracellular repeat protein
MNAPSDPRDRLPPFLRRYCPDQQTCRLWAAKCRSFLYDWLVRFGKACARAWLALVRTSRPFVDSVARRWRELDRKWRIWTVCALVAVLLLPLMFVFRGHRTEPAETPAAAGVSFSTIPQLRYSVTDLGTLEGETSEAAGINNAGQVVGYAHTSDGHTSTFLWENGKGMQDLRGFVIITGPITVIETCRQQERNTFAFVADAVHAHLAGRQATSLLAAV